MHKSRRIQKNRRIINVLLNWHSKDLRGQASWSKNSQERPEIKLFSYQNICVENIHYNAHTWNVNFHGLISRPVSHTKHRNRHINFVICSIGHVIHVLFESNVNIFAEFHVTKHPWKNQNSNVYKLQTNS